MFSSFDTLPECHGQTGDKIAISISCTVMNQCECLHVIKTNHKDKRMAADRHGRYAIKDSVVCSSTPVVGDQNETAVGEQQRCSEQ